MRLSFDFEGESQFFLEYQDAGVHDERLRTDDSGRLQPN
jgi:hypothetical protein